MDGTRPGAERAAEGRRRVPAEAREVVVVGAGSHARSWMAWLRRSARLRAVATVARGDDSAAPDLPRHATLAAALAAHPGAALAVALPPRSALEAALRLVAAGRDGVVQAPLGDALCDVPLAAAAARVRVAHGWVTLPGRRAVSAVLARARGGRVAIEIAGLPEEDRCDPWEGLVHALALARALLPGVAPVAARCADGGLEAALRAPGGDGWQVDLRLRQRGQRLAVRVTSGRESVLWSWQPDRERVMLGDRALVAPRATPPGAVRALAQLLADAPRGDGLAEAAAVQRLARDCLALLPTRLPPGDRALRQSASIGARRPADLLARLGLRGALAPGVGTSVPLLQPALPREPFELWSFRAGLKPVVFLTVHPHEVDQTRQAFGDVHCERRERRVQVGAQDRWEDRRDAGEPRVELYLSRDPDLARRAARLQAEADPSAALREIGALVGYPPCCVDAFARQDDRANNSANRYHSHARTLAADGTSATPWPWELNNLHTMIAPFYPCSYRCPAALAWVRGSLAELDRAHPGVVAELRALLARPVLYFDHDHQIVLDGTYAGGAVALRAARLPAGGSAALAPLAAAVGAGDRLRLDERELVVERGGTPILRLERTDPGLGFVAPFGPVPP